MSYQHFPFDNQPGPRHAENTPDDFVDLERLLQMGMRQAKVVLIAALAGLLVGVVYLQTTPSTYTSSARVLIDEELSKIVDEVSPLTVRMESDAAMLSQLEVLKSARLAGAVVDRLNLHEDESFMNPPVSLPSVLIGRARALKSLLLPGRKPAAQRGEDAGQPVQGSPVRQRAIQMLQGQVRAERVGRSYVIAIAIESHDPRLAARLASAYSEAYVSDQLNAGFDATEQAAVWLQGRLAELRQNSQEAALEVEKYRAEHGLSSSRGELIAERRVGDLSTQLIEAQRETADARARYEQYAAIVEHGSSGAIHDVIESVIIPSELPAGSEIAALRTSYANVVRRQREIEANFGADHQQAVALGREAEELARRITGELRRLTQTYRGEYQVAQAREEALRQNIADASGSSAEANQAQVRLRELEQQASALSALYSSFLDRYERTIQQQTFPVAKVRIISEATVPSRASGPKTLIVLGISLVIGMMAGGSLGVLNEFNERFFRTGEDVTRRLGFKFLGYLPLVGGRAKPARRGKPSGLGVGHKPTVATLSRKAALRVAIDAPASMFAETLRNVKIASDIVLQKNEGKVIGVVSALPGEGKSTAAANLAQLLATNGSKTLLIDGDLRNPALTRALGITADGGLIEAITDAQPWRSLVKLDRQTRLAILPGVVRGQFSHTGEALSSPTMRRLLQEAKGAFDHIIVDLPPLGPVVDAKAFAPLADGFLVIVEWGRTPRALVRTLLASEQSIAGKVLGVVLNKVNLRSLPKYGSFGGSEQFVMKYAEYYQETPETVETPPKQPVKKTAGVPAGQRPAAQ